MRNVFSDGGKSTVVSSSFELERNWTDEVHLANDEEFRRIHRMDDMVMNRSLRSWSWVEHPKVCRNSTWRQSSMSSMTYYSLFQLTHHDIGFYSVLFSDLYPSRDPRIRKHAISRGLLIELRTATTCFSSKRENGRLLRRTLD